MVARVQQPGCQCRSVVIFEGAENIGKSKLAKSIAGEEWYREVSGTLEGKEAHMLMKGAWLVELSELSAMGKTEEMRLKAFVTMANDEYVPKYANDPVKLARRTILIGTVNPEGDKRYLRGQTGNTRFYPVGMQHVDLEYFAKIRVQLFAEALAYYTSHSDDWWQLSVQAELQAREARDSRRQVGVYEDALFNWLDTNKKTVTYWEEICEHFLLMDAKERWKDTQLQREISKALAALGWEQGKQERLDEANGKRVRPWRRV